MHLWLCATITWQLKAQLCAILPPELDYCLTEKGKAFLWPLARGMDAHWRARPKRNSTCYSKKHALHPSPFGKWRIYLSRETSQVIPVDTVYHLKSHPSPSVLGLTEGHEAFHRTVSAKPSDIRDVSNIPNAQQLPIHATKYKCHSSSFLVFLSRTSYPVNSTWNNSYSPLNPS